MHRMDIEELIITTFERSRRENVSLQIESLSSQNGIRSVPHSFTIFFCSFLVLFSEGAGFYINATKDPWSKNYRMYDHIVNEIPAELKKAGLPLVSSDRPVRRQTIAIQSKESK